MSWNCLPGSAELYADSYDLLMEPVEAGVPNVLLQNKSHPPNDGERERERETETLLHVVCLVPKHVRARRKTFIFSKYHVLNMV